MEKDKEETKQETLQENKDHTLSRKGIIVDIPNKKVFKGIVHHSNGKILSIEPAEHDCEEYIMPGFVDSHIHIESSMLVPSEFAWIALQHGTVGTISDPHEIANVLGVKGVEYMIKNGLKSPLKFHFGCPSCVPTTIFETCGASLDAEDVRKMLERDDIYYLSEMMNFVGVINNDEEVHKKLQYAKDNNKPIDGHAPGLRGE